MSEIATQGFSVGGQSAWRIRSKGDVFAALHWVQGEPSIVIAPKRGGMRLVGAVPYVLPLSAAHELVREGSNGAEVDVVVLVEKAATAAEVIGYKGDRYVAHTIADLLVECLDDLCDMPPEPEKGQVRPREEGTVQFRADGKVLWEKDASELA